MQVKFICKNLHIILKPLKGQSSLSHLNQHFHKVFLSYYILAIYNLLQDARHDALRVHIQVKSIELAEPNKVCPYQNTKLPSFQFPFLSFPRVALVLQPYPKFVHFDEVSYHKIDRVSKIPSWPIKCKKIEFTLCEKNNPVSFPVGRWSLV